MADSAKLIDGAPTMAASAIATTRGGVFNLGVDIIRMKLGIFVLAGAMASVAGILLALFVSGAYPEFGFWTTSGEAIFMIMLGSSQLFIGPVIGAILLRLLEHFVSIYTEHHGLVLGIVILAIVLGLRRGVADFAMEFFERRKAAKAPAPSTEQKAFAKERVA